MTRLNTRIPRPSRTFSSATLVALLLASLYASPRQTQAQSGSVVWPAEWQADSSFFSLWSRADAPVETGATSRSWLWGPLPFAVANEPYKESPTGERLVQYFDKGRMEINDPAAGRGSQWFVTSGLLVNEMVTGQVQVGQADFQTLAPSQEPVAGDAGSPDAPAYADFVRYTAPDADATGSPVTRLLSRGGALSPYSETVSGSVVSIATFDSATKHNIPAVFADWLDQKGTVLDGGRLVQDQVVDPLFVLGHPITDPYWTNVLVGGASRTVLVQLFERRALTYDPSNPPEWRVEMANVGQAYYDWRYNSAGPRPAIATNLASDGIAIRGWNWPAAAAVSLQIAPQHGGTPLSGPANVAADESGRFVFTMPYSQPLKDALKASAALEVRAASGPASCALPLAGTPPSAKMHLEGSITMVEHGATGLRITMEQPDGSQASMIVPPDAAITTSEGSPASAAMIDAGIAAEADGELSNGVISVSALRLLSQSKSGASVDYIWNADGTSLFVGGSSWPSEHDVTFALGTADGPQAPFAHVIADSAGNFNTSIKPPGGMAGQPNQWLFATSLNGTDVVAQFAAQVVSLGTAAAPPAYQLYITSPSGAQRGGVGATCVTGKCRSSGSVPLPSDALNVAQGTVLGLRTQSGTNPNTGPSANSLSVQLFVYPAGVQGPGGGLAVPFTPGGTPLYSTGDLPGHPFSVSLPKSLPGGRYVIVISVGWPDSGDGKNDGTYAFTVQVP